MLVTVKCTLSGAAEVTIEVPEGSSHEDITDLVNDACWTLTPEEARHEWEWEMEGELHRMVREHEQRERLRALKEEAGRERESP